MSTEVMLKERDVERLNRRSWLRQFGTGMAGLGLSGIFPGEKVFGAAANPLAARAADLPGKAKACIFLYMYGGPSQMDLFDYKPELQKNDGKTVD
ncbi:MAG: DUF1501 domain-containing protein, partial [Verrucomicrobiales bacterium]|nr:DUF1501 domain-containing protein [Verrucomicrobiales bacterium]